MKEELLQSLKDSHGEIFFLFELNDIVLTKRPAGGGWSPKEILMHIVDAEQIFFERLKRLVAEENPVLQGYDQDAWAGNLRYNERKIINGKALFHACRNALIEVVENFYDSCKEHKGAHTSYGEMTFHDVVEKCTRHSEVHLAQLKKITA